MYDYVLMFLFDEMTNSKVAQLKQLLPEKYNSDKKKPWPPHITVDLYQDVDLQLLLTTIEGFLDQITAFSVAFTSVDHFNNRVLFLKPQDHPFFRLIKNRSDLLLDPYRIANNRRTDYQPHLTLATDKNVSAIKELLQKNFVAFTAVVSDLCLYTRKVELVKKYHLSVE